MSKNVLNDISNTINDNVVKQYNTDNNNNSTPSKNKNKKYTYTNNNNNNNIRLPPHHPLNERHDEQGIVHSPRIVASNSNSDNSNSSNNDNDNDNDENNNNNTLKQRRTNKPFNEQDITFTKSEIELQRVRNLAFTRREANRTIQLRDVALQNERRKADNIMYITIAIWLFIIAAILFIVFSAIYRGRQVASGVYSVSRVSNTYNPFNKNDNIHANNDNKLMYTNPNPELNILYG